MTLGGFTFINDEEFMQAFRGALLESVSHRGNIQGVFI
jgi:hypothetical protein